jgi:hypothetical protein
MVQTSILDSPMVVVGHQRPYGRVSTLPFSFLMENIMEGIAKYGLYRLKMLA